MSRSRRWQRVFASLAMATIPGCGGDSSAPATPPRADRPNVLLVTLDTTRADHLGLYGYPRPTSPQLDRLAEDSVVFTRAVSTSSWTLPAHASLFTGRIPTSHGARFDSDGPLLLSDGVDEQNTFPYRVSTIGDAERTLAERLSDAGYATAGVAGGPWLKRVFGLAAGFDHYDETGVTSWTGAHAPEVTDSALQFLEMLGDRSFFLFVNYFDPHTPYGPPLMDWLAVLGNPLALLRDEFSPTLLRTAYDGEIRRMDHGLGRLLDYLRERGLYDDTLIVIMSDHGELLGEGGHSGHGNYLSEAELHVPLVVKFPGSARAGEREELRVSIAGVFALILEQVGLPLPEHVWPSVTAPLQGPLVAETYPVENVAPDGQWRAIYVGNMKFLWNSKGRHELHDLGQGGTPSRT